MTQKEKIRQHFSTLQSLPNEAEADKYLQTLKQDMGVQSKEDWIDSMKAIKELVTELHSEVMQTARKEQIVVLPASEEEAVFIKNLLKKLNVPFQSKHSKAAKAVA